VQVLDQYEAWLAARGLEPAPSHLGSFLHDGYVADFYAAELALVTWPQPLVAGRGGELVFEVTNTSPQVIAFRATPEAGIHARLDRAALDGAPPRRRHKLRAAEEDLDLAPGKSARFAVELPPFPAPGRYGLRLALVDEDVAWFRDMGSPDLVTHLVVAPAE
jgi:hypothetical protein